MTAANNTTSTSTAPNIAAIPLRASVEAGVVSISFDATIGRMYAAQSAISPSVNAWSVLTNIIAVSTNVVFSYLRPSSPQRFYRVLATAN